MINQLLRLFIGSTCIAWGLGVAGGYPWYEVSIGSVLFGIYTPLSIVSIATWRESRGKDPEDMVGVFGMEASEIVPSFYDIYRNNKWTIFGVAVFMGIGCGVLLGLWFSTLLPGAWEYNTGLLTFLTTGISLCSALGGSGLAITVLFLLKGDRESGMAGA